MEPLKDLKITCERCKKVEELCVCSSIKPLENKIRVLILQHPQEPDHELGSALISHLSLTNSNLKVGLSWANLSKALGTEATPGQWGVLYLGSGVKEPKPEPESKNKTKSKDKAKKKPAQTKKGPPAPPSPLQFVSKSGTPVTAPTQLSGIVIIDGTWSQAKALWWRNPWLLKLKRAILQPTHPSLYGRLRKEPRHECLSTIECIADTLTHLGESPEIGKQLRAVFSSLLQKKNDLRDAKKHPEKKKAIPLPRANSTSEN